MFEDEGLKALLELHETPVKTFGKVVTDAHNLVPF